MDELEARIGQWRTAVLRARTVNEPDADELEEHLREQIADLETAGLTGDEAFLIAVGRLGSVDTVTAEFAREHSDRLWKQLAMTHREDGVRRPLLTMLGFAALAAVLIQVGRLLATAYPNIQVFGSAPTPWAPRDVGLFVLPVLAAYFAVVKRMPRSAGIATAGVVAALALAVNLFPFGHNSATAVIVSIHLPIALWLIVGVAYTRGDVRSSARRMDFIRFTGEWAIYFTLIALGGGVLLALFGLVLAPIAPDASTVLAEWVLPSGAAAGVIVAAWLVEAKKSIIENLAPVLTAIFTPLFAVMLLVSAVTYLWVGLGHRFDRDLLTVFDVLLIIVAALVVYGISARVTGRGSRLMDVMRLVAVVAAIVLDVLVLASMLERVGEFGFTANRVAALGLNIILIVNLAGTAWLLARLLAGRSVVSRLELWQTEYLPVFAAWLALMIVVMPAVFGFA